MERNLIIENAELLKAIANPIRLCLILKLCEKDICNVTYFTNCMDVSQSAISQHLAKLRDLGIVGYTKEGLTVNYYLKNQKIRKIIEIIAGEENE